MSDEGSSKVALAELQQELGEAQTRAADTFANSIINSIIHQHGEAGKAMLGYLAIKIAALMEDW